MSLLLALLIGVISVGVGAAIGALWFLYRFGKGLNF